MRKTAREAAIFTLLASALTGVLLIGIELYSNSGYVIADLTPPGGFLFGVISVGLLGAFQWGAPAGFGLWTLYRLVRFAIKG